MLVVSERNATQHETGEAESGQRPYTESLRYRISSAAGRTLIAAFERCIRPFGDEPFIDAATLPWTHELELHSDVIRRELDALLESGNPLPLMQTLAAEEKAIDLERSWKTFLFEIYGKRWEANRARCPETMRLLEAVPGLSTAMFSVFPPRTRLAPHRGMYKGVLRCQLGLVVPEQSEACGLRVSDRIVHWEQGRCVVFDDTFEHEAWNDTDEMRIVLFLDFARPLPFPLSVINRALIALIGRSPFVHHMIKNLRRFHEREGDA